MISILLGLVLCSALAAVPVSLETGRAFIEREARVNGTGLLFGARTSSAMSVFFRYREVGGQHPFLDVLLASEAAAHDTQAFHHRIRPHGLFTAGDLVPVRSGGDGELGWVGVRLRADGRAYYRRFEAMAAPELRVDVGGKTDAKIAIPLGWVGFHSPKWRIGFGLEDRWFGPGRFGGLMLTDNARPAPLASVATEHRFGEGPARFRLEVGGGWLDAPRTDVSAPGWLLFDARFSLGSIVELGATRMAIFGGVGRPTPELGQLLLPTQPHIENDPENRLPDQDELAALDVRLTLPIGSWLPHAGVDYIELWGQYGGEDVIKRYIGPIAVPALAGIANLWGGELSMGDWTGVVEWARILDDRFRWYTGHRIYHAGFSQAGWVMGHPSGTDSRSWNASVRWMPGPVGAELFVSDVRKVGGIIPESGRLVTLMRDELSRTAGLRGWATHWGRLFNAGLSVSAVSNVGFKPGTDTLRWRVFIGF